MAVTQNLNLYLPDDDDYVSNSRDLNDNFEKIDEAFVNRFSPQVVGTRMDAHGSSNCIKIGRIVICDIRYDLSATCKLFENLPKAKYLARSNIFDRTDTTKHGIIQIDQGSTALYYIHGAGGNAAKYGQVVYVTDE
jgi:hypothetical protein